MVRIHLANECYFPGDELQIVLIADPTDSIQLMSVRCLGYVRVPANVVKEILYKELYTFRDKPIGPEIPPDSFLLWYTPNYPVHINSDGSAQGLISLYVPYFLPPTLKGGMFEISHIVEVSVLKKGEIEMRVKRLPLEISSRFPDMPKRMYPAVGDGYEQFDYNASPMNQSGTPHGALVSNWEMDHLLRTSMGVSPLPSSGSSIFKSRKNFRISFNGQFATEISVVGAWSIGSVSSGDSSAMGSPRSATTASNILDNLQVEPGSIETVYFKFTHSQVLVKRIVVRLIRTESFSKRSETHETVLWSSSLTISRYVLRQCVEIPIPRKTCPGFRSVLLGLDYRLEFELRAIDAASSVVLDPVIWTLPVEVVVLSRADTGGLYDTTAAPLNLGSVPSLVEVRGFSNVFSNNFPYKIETGPTASVEETITSNVVAASLVHPGATKFTVYA